MADAPETPAPRVRARALDLPLGRYRPGRFNAITDVDGVLVGHTTLIAGDGPLRPGKGPVRTGVTAIVPSGGNIFMAYNAGPDRVRQAIRERSLDQYRFYPRRVKRDFERFRKGVGLGGDFAYALRDPEPAAR